MEKKSEKKARENLIYLISENKEEEIKKLILDVYLVYEEESFLLNFVKKVIRELKFFVYF